MAEPLAEWRKKLKFNRAWNFFLREIIKRDIPHGLVHWRYLLPDQSYAIQTHRALWLQSLPRVPRPLWLLIEITLWLRWALWGAWRASFRCITRWGGAVRDREGISMFSQALTVLKLSSCYCLPPVYIYQLRLYRNPERVWEYVYEHEIQAFHRFRSRKLGEKRESLELLQDKFALGEKMRATGLPVADILARVPQGTEFDFSKWQGRKLFCKTRHGSRAEGAFTVDTHEPECEMHSFDGENISETDINRLLAKDDYLIQPCLESHPVLAGLTASDEAITIRLITERQTCYFAWLEIPVSKRSNEKKERQVYVILPINLNNGEILRYPERHLSAKVSDHYRMVYEKMNGLHIPFWHELLNCAMAGQQLFPDVYAIAWDFIVTEQGPLLLEGNTGWGAMQEQLICGGFLK